MSFGTRPSSHRPCGHFPRVTPAGLPGPGLGVFHDRHGPGGARFTPTPDDYSPALVSTTPPALRCSPLPAHAKVMALPTDSLAVRVRVRVLGLGRGAYQASSYGLTR